MTAIKGSPSGPRIQAGDPYLFGCDLFVSGNFLLADGGWSLAMSANAAVASHLVQSERTLKSFFFKAVSNIGDPGELITWTIVQNLFSGLTETVIMPSNTEEIDVPINFSVSKGDVISIQGAISGAPSLPRVIRVNLS